MFSKEIFRTRLKQLRTEKKLTLEEFGEIFSVAKQTTSRWEKGNRLPSIDLISEIADYFNVSIDYLVGRTDNPEVNK